MNGGEALIRGLVASGVKACFANPGTSEMHMVQAIDAVPEMRAVLCLFEGVCTGAADGYGRMREQPACTLLHLGAGLGNGIANLHNARRAATPLVNIIGEHAIHHVPFDAPLTSDIAAIAKGVSGWIRTARTAEALAGDGVQAVQAAMAANPDPVGGVSTLIVPADCAWGQGNAVEIAEVSRARLPVSDAAVTRAAAALTDDAVLIVDGNGLLEDGLAAVGRIAARSGVRIFSPTFPARVESGPGLYPINRMPYFPEQIIETLRGTRRLILAGGEAPVSFFKYRNIPSDLVPEGCEVVRLAHRHEDVSAALHALADAIGAPVAGKAVERARPAPPAGRLNTMAVANGLAASAQDDCIVCTDSGGGGAAYAVMQRAVRHSWMNLTGGSIGQGGPLAVGAAVACPGRRVYALLGDGGAGYTVQYLWTAARENLPITTVIYNNSVYGILQTEYQRIGVNDPGDKALSLFDLSRPSIDWVSLAKGYGVPGQRVTTGEELMAALAAAEAVNGPYLIEAMV